MAVAAPASGDVLPGPSTESGKNKEVCNTYVETRIHSLYRDPLGLREMQFECTVLSGIPEDTRQRYRCITVMESVLNETRRRGEMMTERNDEKTRKPEARLRSRHFRSGIRVVDYTQFLAGPYASRCLAGMGAEVIKVERPKEGDPSRTHTYLTQGISGYYLLQNMGKKGVCVNTKDPRGLELIHKLVATADVFIENYRPGALKKLGLGYEELSKINPRLIYCSMSAFGYTGPDSPRPGYGAIAEARSGAMAQLGVPG